MNVNCPIMISQEKKLILRIESGFMLEKGMNKSLTKNEEQSFILNCHQCTLANSTDISEVVLHFYHCKVRV